MNFSKPMAVSGLLLAAGLFLAPVVIHAAASQPPTTNAAPSGENSTTSTTSTESTNSTPDELVAVLVDQPGDPGATDTFPPVIPGGVGSWEEIFSKMSGNTQYWNCFSTTTGHSKADAEAALAAERRGDNVKLTLYSNVDAATWHATTDTQGLNLDPDVKEVGNLDNTRGAGDGGCEHFTDDRSQVRIALTLPGKDANTPGEPIILAHCGNPLGKPQPKPAVPRKLKLAPKPAPTQPGTTTLPKTVPTTQPPGTTPPPAPPTTVKCPKAGICGTPDAGPELNPVQAPPPGGVNIGPTPGYIPPATPIAGSPGTGAGGTTPHQDGGTNAPVTAPVTTVVQNTQTNNGSAGGPPP